MSNNRLKQGIPLSTVDIDEGNNDLAIEIEQETPVTGSCDNEINLKSNDFSNHSKNNSQDNMMDDDDVFAVDLNEDCWCPCCKCCGSCKFSLTLATILAALLAGILGVIIQILLKGQMLDENLMKIFEFPGKLWIRALKLLVLPLISLMMLILPSRVDKIGRIGRTGLPFFFLTSTLAAIQGTCWVNIIQPGKHSYEPVIDPNIDVIGAENIGVLDTILAVFENAVPDNIIQAMSSLKVLGIITVFLTYGILLRKAKKEDSSVVVKGARALLKCTMLAVSAVVWLTPIGMFSMVLGKITSTEDFFGLLKALGMYVVTALIGHTCHIMIVLPLLFILVAKSNPWKHFLKICPATLTAFATSSSAATLPRSIEVADRANILPNVYQFILPLGSTINMDGTAQGFPIMIMFIAQLYGINISISQQLLILIMSIVISIGTAPVPNAGMVYLILLLDIANLSAIAPDAIATLFILDWFIDRIETSVNVTSDQYICKMVDAIETRRVKKNNAITIQSSAIVNDDNPNYRE